MSDSNRGMNWGIIIIALLVIMAVLAFVILIPPARVDAAGNADNDRCWHNAPLNNFCFKWERVESAGADSLIVRLTGDRPWGHVTIAYNQSMETWRLVSVNGPYPWEKLALWTTDFLNGIDNPDPLLWRPDLMEPYREWLHFTRLHALEKFYIGWQLEEDNAGGVGVYAEGTFPDGALLVRRLSLGGNCYQWAPDWESTSNAAEYVTAAKYIAGTLTGNLSQSDYENALDLLPDQIGELRAWLEYVQVGYGGSPQCPDEPPFIEFSPYRLLLPAVIR